MDSQENILAGFSQDIDYEYPTYWKNCEKKVLQNGEVSGVIRSIAVVNGKVISAGTQSYFPGIPCLWVEDEQFIYDEELEGEVWDMLVIEKLIKIIDYKIYCQSTGYYRIKRPNLK